MVQPRVGGKCGMLLYGDRLEIIACATEVADAKQFTVWRSQISGVSSAGSLYTVWVGAEAMRVEVEPDEWRTADALREMLGECSEVSSALPVATSVEIRGGATSGLTSGSGTGAGTGQAEYERCWGPASATRMRGEGATLRAQAEQLASVK